VSFISSIVNALSDFHFQLCFLKLIPKDLKNPFKNQNPISKTNNAPVFVPKALIYLFCHYLSCIFLIRSRIFSSIKLADSCSTCMAMFPEEFSKSEHCLTTFSFGNPTPPHPTSPTKMKQEKRTKETKGVRRGESGEGQNGKKEKP
jgi:hypothetical protein